MEIKLDSLNFQEVFNAAIMQSLDQGKKEELIKGAISFLMSRPNNSYGNNSPLKDAFEQALRTETYEIAKKYLAENEEIKASILELIKDAVVKMTEDNRENRVAKLADKIFEGLTAERY